MASLEKYKLSTHTWDSDKDVDGGHLFLETLSSRTFTSPVASASGRSGARPAPRRFPERSSETS